MLTTTSGYKTNIDATARQFSSRVSVYFDVSPTVFTGSRLIKWSLLEETKSDLGALGRVSSNTLRLTLANADRELTPTNTGGTYYGKLLPNVKVVLEIGLLVSGSYEWLTMGTFWTSDWLAPESSVEATVDCYDRLYLLGKQDTPLCQVQNSTTVAAMFALLFTELGLTSGEYSIDTTLTQPITIGWLGDGLTSAALQKLSEAGNACVYCDRSGIIQVHNMARVGASVATLADTNQLFDVQLPQRYKDVFSQVTVCVYSPALQVAGEVAKFSMWLPGGSNISVSKQRFSKTPIGSLGWIAIEDDYSTAGLSIEGLEYSSHALNCVLVNADTSGWTANVRIGGKPISNVKSDITLANTTLTAVIGDKKITIDNEMIQDRQTALVYASRLLQQVADGYPLATIKCRGNPALELTDVITAEWGTDTLELKIHRILMDFDGGLTCTVEGMKTSVLAASDYAMVSPGLYVYAGNVIGG